RKPIANDLIYMANAMNACVADGSRGDDCAPRPPLAGEGRDGGRVRGGRLPPTPTLPRKRGRERVSRAGRGGDNCAPLPPLAGEGRDGAGSAATHCPHPNPPPLAGEGAGVAGGPRADGRAPLPPLAGEGR